MKKEVKLLFAGAVTLIVAGTCGACVSNAKGGSAPSTEPVQASGSPAPKSTKAKVVSFKGGTWTVGVDIPPGTYRVTKAIGEGAQCYWQITKSGSNGQDIIANDIVDGGRPTITIKKGQDIEVASDCGRWSKVK